MQVPVVDSQEPRAGAGGATQFVFGVHFDQHVQTVRPGFFEHGSEARIVETRQNRQDGVGAVGGRLHDLVARAEEILAKHRHRSRGTHDVEIGQVAQKVIALGEHADRVGAGGSEGSR